MGDSFLVAVSGLLHEVSEVPACLSTSRSEQEGPILLELIMDVKLKHEERLLTWIASFYAIAGGSLQIKEELLSLKRYGVHCIWLLTPVCWAVLRW